MLRTKRNAVMTSIIAMILAASRWLALSFPPPAPAFEDRGVPTGIAPSPEPFEAKPHQKKFDYNYS
jgi:hypothetical protein